MPKFVFRPERVLKLREAQLKMEKAKIEALRRREENLREAVHLKEQQLREAILQTTGQTLLPAADLNALELYRLRSDRERAELHAAIAQIAKDIERQKVAVRGAQTSVRLLENLRDRRKADWLTGQNRELEELVSEFTSAKWVRQSNRGRQIEE
jgi:hypothetical protein